MRPESIICPNMKPNKKTWRIAAAVVVVVVV
jgi:hypothetical protein